MENMVNDFFYPVNHIRNIKHFLIIINNKNIKNLKYFFNSVCVQKCRWVPVLSNLNIKR